MRSCSSTPAAQEDYQTVDLNHVPYTILSRASNEMPCALTTSSPIVFAERLSRLDVGDCVLYKIPCGDTCFELRVAKLISLPTSSVDALIDLASATFRLQPYGCTNPAAPVD